MELGRDTTATGDVASTGAVDGATLAVSRDAATMAGEDTMRVDAATTAQATVAGMTAARTAMVTPAVVSAEVSTEGAVDSTVAVAMAADADNTCSDLS